MTWLCPIALMLHAAEKAPNLTIWVQRHINSLFTQKPDLTIHFGGIVGSMILAASIPIACL